MKIVDLPEDVIDIIKERVPGLLDSRKWDPLVLKIDHRRSFTQNYLIIVTSDEWFMASKSGARILTENERSRITISAEWD